MDIHTRRPELQEVALETVGGPHPIDYTPKAQTPGFPGEEVLPQGCVASSQQRVSPQRHGSQVPEIQTRWVLALAEP